MKKLQNTVISNANSGTTWNAEKKKWEEDSKINRQTVTEENVAEVVAMMTGVPVQRIARMKVTALINMEDELESSVIGQDECN